MLLRIQASSIIFSIIKLCQSNIGNLGSNFLKFNRSQFSLTQLFQPLGNFDLMSFTSQIIHCSGQALEEVTIDLSILIFESDKLWFSTTCLLHVLLCSRSPRLLRKINMNTSLWKERLKLFVTLENNFCQENSITKKLRNKVKGSWWMQLW